MLQMPVSHAHGHNGDVADVGAVTTSPNRKQEGHRPNREERSSGKETVAGFESEAHKISIKET